MSADSEKSNITGDIGWNIALRQKVWVGVGQVSERLRARLRAAESIRMSVNTKMEHRTLAWVLVITGTRVHFSESAGQCLEKIPREKCSKSKRPFLFFQL